MDKRILLAVAGILIVIVGVFVAFTLTRDGDTVPTPASDSAAPTGTATETPAPSTDPTAAPASAGAYLDYSETAIAEAEGRVLLFFHAPWCPQCRSVEADIVAQGVPAGVTIIKVDYDSNQALRQQYGVTLQTTFVEVDAAGTALQSYVAYDDPHLDAVVDAML